MEKIRIEKEIEVTGEYDLLVAGGGVAGVAAAVTASRMGKKVLLIEKTITLGGLGTIGLVNFFEPICNGRGTVVMKGLAKEMFELRIKKSYDTLPSEWKDLKGPGESATTRLETGYSVNIFIIQLTKWLKDENVDILFDTVVTQPVMEGGKCVGLVVENKTGTQFYKGKMVIDATGDADVMERAGMPTELGKNYHTFYASVTDLESCQNAIDKQDIHEIYAKKLWPGRSNMLG
ncbi:MAG: FAD-dependent oxidoreductase, partial [Clostridia bacterium]|nr:FAD-dependent oxidoreductase [Clostridia bacterium]